MTTVCRLCSCQISFSSFSDVISIFLRLTAELAGKYALVGILCVLKHVRWYVGKIDSAIAAVDKKKLDKVKKELEEGKKLLTDRQKLIKLADRSECGWATVSAYVTDDLADSPDDERRISKAEKSAKKALESKREKLRAKSGSTNYKSNHASLSFVSDSRRGTDDAFKSFRQPFQFRQAAFLPRTQFRRGTCFACGSEGHWRNNCPNITPSTRSDKSTK